MSLEPVIGLEVHVQLLTASKIFCACANQFGGEPNSRICPVCLGYPGTLPVLNRAAVEQALRLALALDATVNQCSIFARKNYFYPDLPKGYQISQFDQPLAEWGSLPLADGSTLAITRLHMEEDAGKLLHEMPGGGALPGESLVDFNRCGVPLLEIVTEPDLRSASAAQDALQRLHQVLGYTGTSDGSMEQGSFRCDANISLRVAGTEAYGEKVEVKNLNSFRNVARAIDHEIQRQSLLLEADREVIQETRSFEANSGTTASLRSKEEAHDYRYFPEPDLGPLLIADDLLASIANQLPELPWSRAERLRSSFGLSRQDAELLTHTIELADYFEQAVSHSPSTATGIANWVKTEVLRELKHASSRDRAGWLPPEQLADLVSMVDQGEISNSAAKQVFAAIWSSHESPRAAMERLNLVQVRDEAQLESWLQQALQANPGPAQQLLAGEQKVIAFLVGQVMKLSAGQADPRWVRSRLAVCVPAESPGLESKGARSSGGSAH